MKLKHLIYSIGISFFFVSFLSSCDKDDTQNITNEPSIEEQSQTNPSTNLPNCVFTLPSGYKVVTLKRGDTEFLYNEDGLVSCFGKNGDWNIIDYTEGSISNSWYKIYFTRNNDGNISSINNTLIDDEYTFENSFNLTYDAEKRLTKIIGKISFRYPQTENNVEDNFYGI